MAGLTNYGRQQMALKLVGASDPSAPTLYLALCTDDPTVAATGAACNEVANANGYERTAITFGAPASATVKNSAAVVFPKATGSQGTATHWVLVDSATYGAGNAWAFGAFTAGRLIVTNNRPTVKINGVQVSVSTTTASDYLVDKLLRWAFLGTAYTQPATYLALTTATVSASSTGSTITEPSGGSYARQIINKVGGSSPAWAAPTNGSFANAGSYTLTEPTGNWGTVVASVLVDASSGGNVLGFYNALDDQPIISGDPVTIAAGALAMAFT